MTIDSECLSVVMFPVCLPERLVCRKTGTSGMCRSGSVAPVVILRLPAGERPPASSQAVTPGVR